MTFILDRIQNGKYSQQKLNESMIINFNAEDDFAALAEISVKYSDLVFKRICVLACIACSVLTDSNT